MGGGISATATRKLSFSAGKKDTKKLINHKEENSNDRVVTIKFEPKPLGCCIRGQTVQKIYISGQAHEKDIKPKWKIIQVNGTTVEDNSLNIKNILKSLMEKKEKISVKFKIPEYEANGTKADVDDIDFALDTAPSPNSLNSPQSEL